MSEEQIFAGLLLDVFVPGIPKGSGSKRAWAFQDKSGKIRANVAPANVKGQRDWQADVKTFAADNKNPGYAFPVIGPVTLIIHFFLPRPQAHYGTGKNAGKLKASAPTKHTKIPDVDKLTRAVADAMKGVIWKDDSQVWKEDICKTYGEETGARIKVMME